MRDIAVIEEGIRLLKKQVLKAQRRLEQMLNPDGENHETIDCHGRVRVALFSSSPKPDPPWLPRLVGPLSSAMTQTAHTCALSLCFLLVTEERSFRHRF
ncbi:hypothetical protein HN011_002481 [Eciton burchellii]|nr:hypothetical protein HN011_002481 [Eciton burchellii]